MKNVQSVEQVASDALEVLKKGSITDHAYQLPQVQLDRKLYVAVNDVLERLGGKWNKKAKRHLFEDDPQPMLQWVFETGMMPLKNPTAYFPTPASLAARMASLIPANARTILEPNAGTGHIARAIRDARPDVTLHCCELLPRFQEKLREQGFMLVGEDFLSYRPEQGYDAILMNPPFSLEEDKMAYVTHIMHAWSLLAPGGHLAAIAPGGVTFSQDKRVKALSALIEAHGQYEELEDNAFKESGTGVRTVLITLHKEASTTDKQPSGSAEVSKASTPEPDFRSKVLSLHEELNQLEREARQIHKRIDQNMKALFPELAQAEEKPAQKPSQMSLW